MSTLNMTTSTTKKGSKIIGLEGEMTSEFSQMMKELAPNGSNFIVGDLRKSIPKILERRPKVEKKDIENLVRNGTTREFYKTNNIYCYLCVRPSDYASYMFSPEDSENRDNEFQRIRRNVLKFYANKFDIYIIGCTK